MKNTMEIKETQIKDAIEQKIKEELTLICNMIRAFNGSESLRKQMPQISNLDEALGREVLAKIAQQLPGNFVLMPNTQVKAN